MSIGPTGPDSLPRDSSETLALLLSRGLLCADRDDRANGRPLVYRPTPRLLQLLGVETVEEARKDGDRAELLKLKRSQIPERFLSAHNRSYGSGAASPALEAHHPSRRLRRSRLLDETVRLPRLQLGRPSVTLVARRIRNLADG